MNNKTLSAIVMALTFLVAAFGFSMLVDVILAESFKSAALVVQCILVVIVGIGVSAYLKNQPSK